MAHVCDPPALTAAKAKVLATFTGLNPVEPLPSPSRPSAQFPQQ
jgi:hypothetical protein